MAVRRSAKERAPWTLERIGAALAILAIVAGALGFFIYKDGFDVLDANVFGRAALDDPVVAWFDDMRGAARTSTPGAYDTALGSLTDAARRRMLKASRVLQREATGTVDRDRTLVDTLLGDPMMWSSTVERDLPSGSQPDLKVDVVNGDEARVSVDGGFVVRYARSGCVAADGPFTVVRTGSSWRIAALPADLFAPERPAGECRPEQVRRSWQVASSRGQGVRVLDVEGLPAWVGDRLQRTRPMKAIAIPETATAKHGATVETLPRYAYDRENRSGGPEGITAWRTLPGQAVGTALEFTFGARIHLTRVRFHNGANNRPESSDYLDHGRVARATIATAQAAVSMTLPDTPDLITVDCDFGTTETVRLQVDAVFPGNSWSNSASSDVALSDSSYWGAPPATAQPTTAQGSGPEEAVSLPDRHFACPSSVRDRRQAVPD